MFVPSPLRAILALAGFVVCTAPAAQAADLMTQLKGNPVITVGTSNDAPLSYLDSQDKTAQGALTDVLSTALERMGVKAEIKLIPMPFSSLIPSLTGGRIDLIGDAMYATPKRAEVIDFTRTTFYNPESLDVAAGNPKGLHSLADLCGHTAGTYEGTTYIDQIRAASAQCTDGKSIELKLYPTIQNVFADLSAGRIDAAVVDSSLSAYALVQNPDLKFELVGDYVPGDKMGSACAFGVTKGNDDFRTGFDKVYGEMLADGTAAKIFEKWGLTPTGFFLNE